VLAHARCVALMMHYAALVDDNASELSAAIGAKVRSERQARAWTLDELARQSGVSRRMLINVEQGTANPSVTTLLRLSDALGIGLQALVAVPQTKPVKVIRAGDAPALWAGEHGGRGVLLAGTAPPDILELWDWTLAPGDRHDSEAHVRGTKEILQIREGTVNVTVGDQSEVLSADDAISFASDVPHSYANEGAGPARFSLTVFEPGVGSGTTTEASHD
jgi:transcriptional regulator with XRE-family HTH domain